jgi:diamine N-acetyltransferase
MKISTTKDYETIGKLNKHVHNFHKNLAPDRIKPYNEDHMINFYKKMIDKENHTFLLLEDHGESIGFLWMEVKEYDENVFKYGYTSVYVHQISINENYRSGGYGTKLMEVVEEFASERNISKIELDYWAANSAGERFYERLGFHKHRVFVCKEL